MRRALLVVLGLVLLNVAVFGQTLRFDFINYDDPAYVTKNPRLYDGLSAENLRRVFSAPYHDNYMPLTALSYFTDYERAATDPSAYHLTNLLLHTINSILLFVVLVRLTASLWPSALVAALFAVHPLHVESVAWVAERKDLLSTFFGWLALGAYTWYARRPRPLAYAVLALFFLAGLLSKPMLVTLPCVMLLLDYWPLERAAFIRPDARKWARLFLEKLPLLAMSAALSVVTLVVQTPGLSRVESLGLGDRMSNAVVAYVRYLVHTVWPVGLIPHYPHPGDTLPLGLVAVALLVIIAITIAAWRLRNRAPYLLVGWLWYLGTLVPVIGVVQVGGQAMADRYTYIPLVGIFIAIAWGLNDLIQFRPRARVPAAALSLAVIAVLSGLAYGQTSQWRDSRTLWTYATGADPANFVTQSLLGEALLSEGEIDAARQHLANALELAPHHRPALLNMARLDIAQGRLQDAVQRCQTLIARNPADPDAHTTWASVLIRQGKLNAAIEQLDIALAKNPDHADALTNYGAALLFSGRSEEAIPVLERAIRAAPADAAALTNLAAAHFDLGQIDDARRYCQRALDREPDFAKAQALQRELDQAAP